MIYIRELIKKTGIIAIGKMSTQVMSFFLLPVYTSLLSTSDYGVYDYVIAISAFLLPIITLSLEDSCFRFLVDAKEKTQIDGIITNMVVFILCSSLSFVLILGVLNQFFQINELFYLIGYILSSILIALTSSIARGKGNIKLYSIANFITGVAILLLNIFFLIVLGWRLKGLFFSCISANVLGSLFMILRGKYLNNIKIRYVDKRLMKEMLHYSLPLVPNNLSWSIVNVSDRFFIINFLGESTNGMYAIANKFPTLINTFFSFFVLAWKEVSAKVIGDDDSQYLFKKFFEIVDQGMLAFISLFLMLLTIIYDFFIAPSYQISYIFVPLLTYAVYFLCLANYVGGIFTAKKQTKHIGRTTVIGALINILINIILIKFIGLHACVISTFISNLVIYITRIYQTKYLVKNMIKCNAFYYILNLIAIIVYYIHDKCIASVVLIVQIVLIVLKNRGLIKKIISYQKKSNEE